MQKQFNSETNPSHETLYIKKADSLISFPLLFFFFVILQMFITKIAISLLIAAGVCHAAGNDERPFQLRSPTSSRVLGFKYDSKAFLGGECKETYNKYLKATEEKKEGVHFQLKDCDDDGYCRLYIVDGDYQGYCLGGQPRPESQTCNTDNNIFKINLDFTITTRDGKYLGIGDEYYDDCTNFQYAKFGDEKYHWKIEHDKKKAHPHGCMSEEDDTYRPRGSSQRIFKHD